MLIEKKHFHKFEQREDATIAADREKANAATVGVYRRKYQTIAHDVLELESAVRAIPDSFYELLDRIISTAQERISTTDTSDRGQAMTALVEIENILLENNFVCSVPIFLVKNLSDTLTANPLNRAVSIYEENQKRRAHVEAHA